MSNLRNDLHRALSSFLPTSLAADVIDAFLELRQDAATTMLGRGSAGKFVEIFVQILQYLGAGAYDKKPKVDDFLRQVETSFPSLEDGLRLCGARIARGMYTLRNKRNIAHKGEVDPNEYDLKFLLSGAQWIVAELLRNASGLSMTESGRLVDRVTAPIGGIVEDFGGKRIVHGELTVAEEILVLLHNTYPNWQSVGMVTGCLDRRSPGTVRKELRKLWKNKLVEGSGKEGYGLTTTGHAAAITILNRELEARLQKE